MNKLVRNILPAFCFVSLVAVAATGADSSAGATPKVLDPPISGIVTPVNGSVLPVVPDVLEHNDCHSQLDATVSGYMNPETTLMQNAESLTRWLVSVPPGGGTCITALQYYQGSNPLITDREDFNVSPCGGMVFLDSIEGHPCIPEMTSLFFEAEASGLAAIFYRIRLPGPHPEPTQVEFTYYPPDGVNAARFKITGIGTVTGQSQPTNPPL